MPDLLKLAAQSAIDACRRHGGDVPTLPYFSGEIENVARRANGDWMPTIPELLSARSMLLELCPSMSGK